LAKAFFFVEEILEKFKLRFGDKFFLGDDPSNWLKLGFLAYGEFYT
jgi:hypothetical protein